MMGSQTTRADLAIYSIVAGLVAILLCSCEKDPTWGPCYHEYLTPIVEVESASIVGTPQLLSGFTIVSVERDGYSVSLEDLVSGSSFGVVLEDSVLVCTVPCGFATQRGTYIIGATGEGLLSRTFEVEANYVRSWGNCPSFSSGATKVSFVFGERN